MAGMVGRLRSLPLLAISVGSLSAAHAALWSMVWTTFDTVLWLPWVAPLPVVIPALIQLVSLAREHS